MGRLRSIRGRPKRLDVDVEEAQYQALSAYAEQTGVSLAEATRRVLEILVRIRREEVFVVEGPRAKELRDAARKTGSLPEEVNRGLLVRERRQLPDQERPT